MCGPGPLTGFRRRWGRLHTPGISRGKWRPREGRAGPGSHGRDLPWGEPNTICAKPNTICGSDRRLAFSPLMPPTAILIGHATELPNPVTQRQRQGGHPASAGCERGSGVRDKTGVPAVTRNGGPVLTGW
jgi:hypothetical protein